MKKKQETTEPEQDDFALTATREGSAPLVEVEQQRAVAETQSAMIIAKRFPRDVKTAIDRIINACSRPGLAEAALYQYARGGTDITGPSIRLAEAVAQNWGNLQFGIRELEQRQGVSTVEAFAWDIETNTRQVKIFQVAHKRYTKKGSYSLEDPRDIYEMVANQGARRLRACILGIIPGDVVESAVRQCEATLSTKAAVTPARIAGTVEKFKEFGVTKEQLEARIQRRLEAMTAAQMVNLAKIYNSLKDGMSTPADWFDGSDKATERPAEDTDKEFYAQAEGMDMFELEVFVKETAAEHKCSEAEVRADALKQWRGFVKFFEGWKAKLEPKGAEKPAAAKATGEAPPPDEEFFKG